MAKLRLGPIESDKPVRITIEVSAAVHRDLIAYAEAHARETGQSALEPGKLIGPMVQRFMATDRGFTRTHRQTQGSDKTSSS